MTDAYAMCSTGTGVSAGTGVWLRAIAETALPFAEPEAAHEGLSSAGTNGFGACSRLGNKVRQPPATRLPNQSQTAFNQTSRPNAT
jgi:hypothetical protein